jgi:hypothetical protein
MSDDEEGNIPISRLAAVEVRDGSLGNEVANYFGEVAEYDREGGDGTEEHCHVDWEDG